ncbi:gliding motility protein GldM [Rapidithrix thailandica]|uniref:Gliding motility protein GldM n=1 Tax=Rapidithrix thailandica TaxID=413964 RepID=A0AAW9S3C0_9BACT
MAGGAKESPRQRMIGMMYLVLTALLALQVSNTVLEKFIFIDESLRHSVSTTTETNSRSVDAIRETVKKNGNRERDVSIVKKAEQARSLTSKVMKRLSDFREEIVKVSGGKDPETGVLLGAKDYDKQMAYTIGPEGSKKGEAYKIQKELNDYVTEINKLHKDLNESSIALDGKDHPLYKNNPEQKSKDFAYLNFDHTPAVACLAIVSELQSKVARVEAKALEVLASEVGADQLKFDKIVAVVKPQSQVVAAGTEYVAEMFLAASSSGAKPEMTFNGKAISVEGGIGQIKFKAQGGGYDKEGKAKKTWKGAIKINTPLGDTTFEVTEEYFVAKPVVQVQSQAVSALYYNCGNELVVNVPALGTAYQPSFKANGASVIKGSKKGEVTVVPTKGNVTLSVYSSGNKLDDIKLRVKPVPKPEIKVFSGRKPVDLRNGYTAPGPRSIEVKAIPDADFKSFLPKDARYKVVAWEATLARGKRGLASKKVTSETVNVSDFAAKAKSGDRIVIEIKRVMRMNFRGQTEAVKGLDDVIFTIPIN